MTDVRVPRESAIELLRQLRDSIGCTVENDSLKMPTWVSTKHPLIQRIDALLAAEPPAVEEVEVVGHLVTWATASGDPTQTLHGPKQPEPRFHSTKEPLMTVRQHEAILAAALAAK